MTGSTSTTTQATCKFPGCERPPRPASGDGRGAKPQYCDLTDDKGKPKHTALTAFRERERLDRRAAGGAASPADLDRPVTMATARAAQLRTEITDAVDKLTLKLTAVMGELERIADPEAAEAQIEAVQAEAAAQVADARGELAREAQRRQSAEADAEEARTAALEMDAQLQTTEQARTAAEGRAEQAAGEVARITQESTEQVQAAQAEVERARNEVLEKVRAAHAEAEASAERQVEQARAQAAEHVDRADRTVRDSQAEVARARQAEADAKATAAEVRQEMTTRLADQRGTYEERIAELTLARDEARDRARRAEAELDNLAAQRERLAGRVEDLQAELAQVRVQLAAQGSAAADAGDADQPGQQPKRSRGRGTKE